jgi:hypothetical protein
VRLSRVRTAPFESLHEYLDASMPNGSSRKTEEEVTPHAWLGVLIALVTVVLLAALATGIWYFLRGRKEIRQTPGTPQALTSVIVSEQRWRSFLSLSGGRIIPDHLPRN